MENQLTSRGGKIAHKTCIQVSFDLHGRAEGEAHLRATYFPPDCTDWVD